MIDEDTSLTYTVVANDVDGDELSYSASIDGNGSVDMVGTDLTIIPDTDFNGSIVATVIVSDGEYTDSDTFTLTVNPVNDSPVLANISDIVFDEDQTTSLSLSASDVDEDDLTFSILGGNNISASLSGSDVLFSALENYNGSEIFTISVSDGQYTDSQDINVTVNPVNDAPIANDI